MVTLLKKRRTNSQGTSPVRVIQPASEPAPDLLLTLIADELVKKYKKRRVVDGVSIKVRQGEIVGLLGPNGAGKTTTFHMITGMVKPNGGRVFFDSTEQYPDLTLLLGRLSTGKREHIKDITKLPLYKRARLGIAYLPQEASIFRGLTVEQNILSILETTGVPRKKRKNRLEEMLMELNIQHLAKHKAYTLSGGERRRVEITRALVNEPKFILLDEPFAGVDPIAVAEIQDIVRRLRQRGIGVLITDHNVHETLEITDRAYLLYDGKVLKSGSAELLTNDPEALKLYLGEKFRLNR